MSSPFQKQFSKKTPFLQRIQSESAPEIKTSQLGDVNELDEFFTNANIDYTLGDKRGSIPNSYEERRITDEVTGELAMQPLSDVEKERVLIMRGLNKDNSLMPYQETHGVLETQGGEMDKNPDGTTRGRIYPRTVVANQSSKTRLDGFPNPDKAYGDYNIYPTDLRITDQEMRSNKWDKKRKYQTFLRSEGDRGFDYESKNKLPRDYQDFREAEMVKIRKSDSTATMNQRNFNAKQRVALGSNMRYNRNPNQ